MWHSWQYLDWWLYFNYILFLRNCNPYELRLKLNLSCFLAFFVNQIYSVLNFALKRRKLGKRHLFALTEEVLTIWILIISFQLKLFIILSAFIYIFKCKQLIPFSNFPRIILDGSFFLAILIREFYKRVLFPE